MSRSLSTESYFSVSPSERSEQLRNVSMYLRSVVLYNPKDQSKGKPPKFRGSDAMSVLITSGLVDSEIDAGEILEELEKDGLVVPSKGNLKSPKKVGDRKFR